MSINGRLFQLAGILLVVVAQLFLASCGSSNDPADLFLDEYEELVDTWAAKVESGSLSMSDLGDLNIANASFTQRANALQASGTVFTPAQLKRHGELTMRFAQVMSNLGNSPPSFTIPDF